MKNYHKDVYALQILGQLLSGSKKSPLYKILVEEKKLAPNVNAYQNGNELAGEFIFRVRTNAGKDLDEVKTAIEEGLNKFEAEGFSDNELKRIKAELETRLYQGIGTVLNKAFQLVRDNEFNGDPGYITQTVKHNKAVTKEDVMRVYNTYIKGKNYILTSVVPKGQVALAVSDSEKAEVWIEEVKQNVANEEVSQGEEAVYEKTPSKYDRSEPPFGELPLFESPEIWKGTLSNGMAILGIENNEVPLVQFDITIPGGHLLDPEDKSGVANLLSDLMMEGTAAKTPADLEEAIGLIGANINIYSTNEDFHITGSCLTKNFEETIKLIEEIMLQPRWDEAEYSRLKQALETGLKGREANPNAIAGLAFNKLIYGEDHMFSIPGSGTLESTASITMDDLKAYYNTLSPKQATLHVAGAISKDKVEEALLSLSTNWNIGAATIPDYKLPSETQQDQLYFIDFPGAKQSVILIGRLALSGADKDANNLGFANDILGGGSSGRLFQTLRIEKGYTYGAFSRISQSKITAPFFVQTSVRANATLPSLEIIKDMITGYADSFTDNEVELTKNKLLKENTRAFESLGAKLGILTYMSKYNMPLTLIEDNQNELINMALEDYKSIISKYLNEPGMIYVIVGDKATQFEEVKKLGKTITELDIYGNKM